MVLTGTARAANDEQGDLLDVWGGQFVVLAPTPGKTGPRFWLDLHERRTPSGFTAIIRPAFGWQATPWFSVWAGYAWVPTDPDGADTVHEHRAWEQLIFQHKTGPALLQLRLRQEQRFRQGEAGVGNRLRVFGRVNAAVSGPFGLAMWDEAFFQFNDPGWVGYTGFDQNRAFFGPYLEGPPGVRLEVGYMNQYLQRPEGASQDHHVVAFNLFISWGPKEKKGGG